MKEIRRTGFTLIEMMAVVGIIALVTAMVLPTVARLFRASSDEQARQILSAALTGARAKAIEDAEYRIVHVQVGKEGSTWVCSMAGRDEGRGMEFGGVGLLWPRRIPGRIAFGGIAAKFLLADGYRENLTDGVLEDFTEFNIGFSPDGMVVTDINGAAFALDSTSPVFGMDDTGPAIWDRYRWAEFGVRAVTYFPYPELRSRPATTNDPELEETRTAYLNANSQFLALSPLTGRVMEAK